MTNQDRLRALIDLAEMSDEAGQWERPIADAPWAVPDDIARDGDDLVYRWGARSASATAGPGLLERFVELANPRTDPATFGDRVLIYARRYGVFEVCGAHLLPLSHARPPVLRAEFNDATEWCWPLGWRPDSTQQHYREPLDVWRRYARQARAVVVLAAQLHLGKPTDAGDWRAALGWPDGLGSDQWIGGRATIANVVSDWLSLAAVRPVLDWGGPVRDGVAVLPPTTSLAGDGLFAALAVQLLGAVSRTRGMSFCSGCGNAYAPIDRDGRPYRPSPHRRHYCPACRAAGVPERDASRDYRKRQRAI